MQDASGLFDIVFRFPERLLAAMFVAVLCAVLFAVKYRDVRRALEMPWIRGHLDGARVPSALRYIVSCSALIVASTLLVAVWAEPERKIRKNEPLYGAMRIVFLIDSSRSMVYGEDVAPNRLAAAKEAITAFIRALRRDPEIAGRYEMALVPFAGAAIPSYSSFTTSEEEIISLLESINEQTVTRQGTSFSAALKAYTILRDRNPPQQPNTRHLLIIVSDGGKEEGIHSERNAIAGILQNLGPDTIIRTVGVGSKERDETCLALRKDAKEPEDGCLRTKPVRLVVRDADGHFVDYLRKEPWKKESPALYSELDEAMLMFLATPTKEDAPQKKQNYRFFTDKEEILASFKEFVIRYRVQVGTADSYRYEPVLSWFLVPAFVIFYFSFGFGGWIVRSSAFFTSRLRRLRRTEAKGVR